jgi:hypothetical protein
VRRDLVLGQVNLVGLRLNNVQRGDWRDLHSYAITQDYVVANLNWVPRSEFGEGGELAVIALQSPRSSSPTTGKAG